MAETKQMIRCDECRGWFEMKADELGLFSYPDLWFIFRFRGEKHLCSWRCTKNFVDRMYAERHPENPR